jgi:hypothetical protein
MGGHIATRRRYRTITIVVLVPHGRGIAVFIHAVRIAKFDGAWVPRGVGVVTIVTERARVGVEARGIRVTVGIRIRRIVPARPAAFITAVRGASDVVVTNDRLAGNALSVLTALFSVAEDAVITQAVARTLGGCRVLRSVRAARAE